MGGKGGSFSQGGTTVNVNSMDMRTDAGWTSGSSIAQAAMVAVAAMNAAAAKSMNDRQVDIARGHLALAQQLQGYWFGSYVPREQSMVAEAHSEPLYTEQYDMRVGQFVAAARHQYKGQMRKVASVGRYCTGLTSTMLKDLYVAENIAVSMAGNMAYRYEDIRKQAKDAVRWDRKIQSLGLGKNLLKESLAASMAASNTFGDLADRFGGYAASALQGLGYFIGRRETNPPQNQGYNLNTQAAQYPQGPPEAQSNIPVPQAKPLNIPVPREKPQNIRIMGDIQSDGGYTDLKRLFNGSEMA